MIISVEISYYPLKEDFIPSIVDFIHRLGEDERVSVTTNGMSTQMVGEYDEVMSLLTREIKKTCEIPHSIFILKIVNSDRR
ncbi:MAG: thiamine-binding protein [Lentimicrobiaceae bacterium]|jgi:uncharacterized protein YqgV (UPF0045/DUF77 family)|nr:thiamine-binding protein [Lentimicrobiaceae bacterium]